MDLQTAGTQAILRTALAHGDFPILVRNMESIPEEFDSIVKFVTFNHQAASTEKTGTGSTWVAVIDAGRHDGTCYDVAGGKGATTVLYKHRLY